MIIKSTIQEEHEDINGGRALMEVVVIIVLLVIIYKWLV